MAKQRVFRLMATSKGRDELLDGRAWYVVPVVAVKAGVLNGELLVADAIEASVRYWNDVPVCITHPKMNGVTVSAKNLSIIKTEAIGRFYNAYYDDGALKGELWIDVEKSTTLGGVALTTLEKLQNGDLVEVSTAYFVNLSDETGIYNNKEYSGVQSDLKPDHIALLPSDIGACSLADGCGANRTNEAGDEVDILKVQLREGESINDRRVAVEKAIANTFEPGEYAWVADVYETFVVYEYNDLYYQSPYTIGDAGAVTLGPAIQVKRTVGYAVVRDNVSDTREADKSLRVESEGDKPNTGLIDKIKHLLGVNTMSKKEELVKDLRDQSIEIAEGLLENADEGVLQWIADHNKAEEIENVEKTGDEAVTNVGDTTVDEYLKANGTDLVEVINHINELKTQADAEKAALVDTLVANEGCNIKKETLEALDVSALTELSAVFQPGSYVGKGLPVVNEDSDSVPAAPAVILNKEEVK